MKILFLYANPYNNAGIPIGLSYLIAILKNKGYEIELFDTTFYDFDYSDFNMGKNGKEAENVGEKIINEFNEKVKRIQPDLIGVSSTSLCLSFSIKLLESLEEKPKIVFGGVGPTVDYVNLIKKNVADFVCIGFGEICLPKLVENLGNEGNLSDVPNLLYKSEGKIIKNEFSQEIDFGNLPIPDWSLFDKRHFEKEFKGEIKRWGSFQLSRGCPFNCAYCINAYYHNELKMNIYRFPAEKIIEEMKALSKKYDLDIIRIFDECFGFGDLNYYKKFAEFYKKEVNLPTIIATRPETIVPERIEILKYINCISVSLGIEVGDKEQREKMLNRYIKDETIINAFKLLHEAKIRSASYNIIGFPEDTREKIFKTIKLNKKCKPDFINVFLFCPFPKTQLREDCLKDDCLEITDVVDYLKTSIIKNKNLSKEELYGLFRTFRYYIKFPEYLYPLIKRAEEFDEIGNEICKLLDVAIGLQPDFDTNL